MLDEPAVPTTNAGAARRLGDSYIVDFVAGIFSYLLLTLANVWRSGSGIVAVLALVVSFACAGFLRTRRPPVRRWITAVLIVCGGAISLQQLGGSNVGFTGLRALLYLAGIALSVLLGIQVRRMVSAGKLLEAIVVAALPTAVAGCIAALFGTALMDRLDHPMINRPMPAISLRTLENSGQPIDLKSWRGQVVVLTFWATWCGPCKEELPELERLQQHYKDDSRVIVLAADVGPAMSDTAEKAQAYLQAQHLKVSGAVWGGDSAGFDRIRRDFNAGIPALFVVGKDGRLRLFDDGYSPDEHLESRLIRVTDELLKE